jgi:Flp pilus assembly protein TadG
MFRPSQKGSAGVEFAMVLPLLLMLVFGTVEFGVLFYNRQMIVNASREGARAAITGEENAAIRQIVRNYCESKLIGLKDALVVTDDDITITPPDGQDDLSVSVAVDYPLLFASLIGIEQTKLSANTIMRMEPE